MFEKFTKDESTETKLEQKLPCLSIFFVLFCSFYLRFQISLANSCLLTVLIVTIFYLLLLNDTVTRKCLTLLNSVKAKMRIILALCLIIAASGLLIINNCDYLMNFVSKSLNCCVNFFSNIFIYFENFLTVCLEVAAMIYFICFLFKSIWVRFITCKEA